MTYTGKWWDITDPTTWVFDPVDIAFALSNVCRFAGHVEFKSVAEHSIEVQGLLKEWGAPADVQLAGLLHDASEAYLLDIPRPWKGLVYISTLYGPTGFETYYEVEDRLMVAIMSQFGVLDAWEREGHGLIKEADMAAYEKEAASRPYVPRSGASPHAIQHVFLARIEELSS